MKVRQHFFPNGMSPCVFCGAPAWPTIQKAYSYRGEAVPQKDERECVWRDDFIDRRYLCPEPKRREYACEDAATIAGRIDTLNAERLANVEKEPEPVPIDLICGVKIDKLLVLSEKSIG